MRFNPDLLELIPPSHLDADFGGDFHYEFEPKSYWDQIVESVRCRFPYVTNALIVFFCLGSACGIAPDGTRIQKMDEKLQPTPVTAVPLEKSTS